MGSLFGTCLLRLRLGDTGVTDDIFVSCSETASGDQYSCFDGNEFGLANAK